MRLPGGGFQVATAAGHGRRSAGELAGGVAALAAPVVMWTEFLVFGLRTPGYSIVTRAASDLGARGAPGAGIFVAGFFYGSGALVVLLGASLALAPAARLTWRVGAGLVIVEGILLVLAGAVPEDLGAAGSSPHQLLATGCFSAAALAPAVLAAGGTAVAVPPFLRRLWLASGGALLLLFLGATLARAVVRFPDGLFQRPFGLVLTVWFVATSLWLLHGPERPPGSRARRGPNGRRAQASGEVARGGKGTGPTVTS